ncbi:hypothetical protein SDC9_153378 [bioreactor metagenome]|uniref:Uncharacterized protein n=1 Tax=bioreactor metagenome TaxID=1076179 RepID=A0A645F0D6_9ZZZZ
MSEITHIATPFNQLNDVKSIFRFHHVRHLLGITQGKCHIGKLGNQLRTGHKSQFTPFHGRRIFRMQQSQGGKLSFSTVYLIGIFTQPFLHLVNLLQGNFGLRRDDLHFQCGGYKRKTVLWQAVVIFPYF